MSISKGKLIVSVVIPVYNESNRIGNCVTSLEKQDFKQFEVIFVDDGSTDSSIKTLENQKLLFPKLNMKILKTDHCGPGGARNIGVRFSRGKIIILVDADMVFETTFISNLVKSIIQGKSKGTDTQSVYLANPKNKWALCWNIGRFIAANNYTNDYKSKMIPNLKDFGGVFRAILKSEFVRVGGFSTGGEYTDDVTLAQKLGYRAGYANNAKYYHYNPESLLEVWKQARWIGKTNDSISLYYVFKLINFSFVVSIAKGFIGAVRFRAPFYILFKLVYDLAIFTELIENL